MPLISKSTVVCFNRVCPILTWIFVEDKYPSWQYVLPRGRLTIAGLGRSPMEYIAIMEACMNWQKRWLYLVFLGQKNGKLWEKTHPPKKYIRKNRTFEKYHFFSRESGCAKKVELSLQVHGLPNRDEQSWALGLCPYWMPSKGSQQKLRVLHTVPSYQRLVFSLPGACWAS